MAVVLFNPTNEDFEATYGGVTFKIPSYPKEGHMVRVDDNKGNHILNQLGPRGLTSLDYGDEGTIKEQKAKDGVRRNLDFKRKQISRYNQDNEQRKATQRIYIDPPDFVREYAKELGIGLIAPYEIQDVKNEEIAELKKQKERDELEKKDLKDKVDKLLSTVEALIGKVKSLEKTDEDIAEEEKQSRIEEQISKLKGMNRNQFRPHVEGLGIDGYKALPLEIQQFTSERWGGFFNKEEAPFPY